MKLTHDTLDCILRECNLETIEQFLMMNHKLRDWILANRKSYARIPVKMVYVEADMYSETSPWNIKLFLPSTSTIVGSSKIEEVNLSHFTPSHFEYHCLTRNGPFDSSPNMIFENIPREWFRELESVRIEADNNEMVKHFYDETLKLFASLSDLAIIGYLPYSHFSQVLDLMHDVRRIRIYAQIESEMMSTNEDLDYLIENANGLENLSLKSVKNVYTAEKFIEFLKNTKFAKSVRLEFSDWPKDGELIYRFFKDETDLQESVYLPITRYHEDNPPVLPHRYIFLFKESTFSITFDKNQLINDPRLLQ